MEAAELIPSQGGEAYGGTGASQDSMWLEGHARSRDKRSCSILCQMSHLTHLRHLPASQGRKKARPLFSPERFHKEKQETAQSSGPEYSEEI